MVYTLMDLVRLSGLSRRTIQFWTDNGVLLTNVVHGGTGNPRKYTRYEATIASIIAPAHHAGISIAGILDLSAIMRERVKRGVKAGDTITIDNFRDSGADLHFRVGPNLPD